MNNAEYPVPPAPDPFPNPHPYHSRRCPIRVPRVPDPSPPMPNQTRAPAAPGTAVAWADDRRTQWPATGDSAEVVDSSVGDSA